MNLRNKILIAIIITPGLLANQACGLFGKSEFAKLNAEELTILVESLPSTRVRTIAESQMQRKELIKQLSQAFSIAQAAEDEGLDDTERFKRQLAISENQMLAAEFRRRNQNLDIPQKEVDAYVTANKESFEADLEQITEGAETKPTDEQREMLKSQWGEMRIRADRARQAGIDKEQAFTIQLKFNRANLLANHYAQELEKRHKLSDEEKKKYISEHPEADPVKIKASAQALLDRVKKGESFEKIADEVNEDGTRGNGGDLDWFTKGRMDPVFEDAAFALKKGETSSELVKSSFGYHIIRVDDRRMVKPKPDATPAADPGQNGEQSDKKNNEPQEEVRARHIFLSLQEPDSFEQRLVQEKVKRAIEDVTIKFPVEAPEDFKVTAPGMNPNRLPGLGGGQGGRMRRLDPNENR